MARVVVIGGGFGGLAVGPPAGQARSRGDAGRGARARRRARPGDRRRLHLGRRGPHPAARRWCATCSARPAARWRGSSTSSSSTVCASTGSTTARRSCCRRDAPRSSRRSRRSGRGSAPAWLEPRRSRTPTTGRCCGGATSRCRGTPTTCRAAVAARLDSRETLQKRLRRACPTRARGWSRRTPSSADGHDLRDVPAWAGLDGVPRAAVRCVGGRRRDRRPAARRWYDGSAPAGSQVVTARATDVVVRDGRAVAVATASGDLDADVVVCAVDPRRLPALAPYVARTTPAIPPVTVPRRSRGRRCATCPTRSSCTATRCSSCGPAVGRPAGQHAWTRRTVAVGSPRTSWPRSPGTGLDVRAAGGHPGRPLRRVTWSSAGAGPRCGVQWQGRGTVRRRLGPRTPVDGVYAAGAHATPGRRAAVRRPVGCAGRAGGRPGVGLGASSEVRRAG